MIDITQINCQSNLIDLGIIQITGKNAEQFLQGQLTCDVTKVNSEQNRLGAHCDAKGRVQATFRLFFYQDAYYFLLPQKVIPHLLTCLTKYAVFSAVHLVDVSQNCSVTGVTGPSIEDVLNTQALLPRTNATTTSSEGIISLTVTGGSTPRFILVGKTSIPLTDNAVSEVPINDWHLLDIIAGIPTVYPETIGQFTPHQLNYPAIAGVSFDKGCYIGQEIIARTHYLGKSKSHLYRLVFQANKRVPPGTPLQDEKGEMQGTVIMAAHEKNSHYQALACLQTQAISHTIRLEGPRGPIVQLLELPS